MLDIGLYVFYVLLAIAVIAAIVFPMLNAIKTPKALLKSLIGLGVLLLLFGIAYALSNSDVAADQTTLVSPGGSRLISAGLILFYITLVLSALAVIYSEITKSFK